MKKFLLLSLSLLISFNLEAVRLWYCQKKNSKEVAISRYPMDDPIVYNCSVYDLDETHYGIVTLFPFIDQYCVGHMEQGREESWNPNSRVITDFPAVVEIKPLTFAGVDWITRINIPATIKTIGVYAFKGCKNLQYIHVDPKNPYFSSDDGVLYNKDKTILITFPPRKDISSYTIPNSVIEIAEDAFDGCNKDNPIPKDTGNPNFDKTTNYQFDNVPALVGETLYVAPRTGSNYCIDLFTKEPNPYYPNFMDYEEFYADKLSLMITGYHYKFGVRGSIDCAVAGTHKDWLENHKFRVDKVTKMPDYNYMWVLHLTDLATGDQVKYVTDAEVRNTQIDMVNFPFIVMKHFEYLKSLIGTNVVFATNDYKYSIWEHNVPCYFTTFKTDINTGEEIHYSTPYVKWTITDVEYDVYDMKIYFIVSDGKHTTKVAYDNPYTKSHSKYNVGNRVFPEKQWNELVDKYGEYHMSLIMQTESTEDMTLEEKYMSGGRRLVRHKTPDDEEESEVSSAVKEVGSTLLKSVKETAKDLKGLGKELFGK